MVDQSRYYEARQRCIYELVQGDRLHFFIESLRQHRDDPLPTIELVTSLAETEHYTLYDMAYNSDGLRITGIMNVPEREDDARLPVILLNHGYYNPGTYTPGTGTQREADYLAQYGYVTIASDYRGYAGSEGDFGGHFDPGWTYDILDLLDALPSLDFVDPERVGMWGHSTDGEIVLRVIAARDDVKATVLFGSMGADAADNFRLVQGWGGGHAVVQHYGSPEETPEVWAKLFQFRAHHLEWRKVLTANPGDLSSGKPANPGPEY